MNVSGIYTIVHREKGKRYIGSAVNIRLRRNEHYKRLRRGIHENRHLQHAWNKYGESAFQFKPLLICAPKDLLSYEQRCFDGYKPEYNICPTARSKLGVACSPETREKIAAAQRGRTLGPHSAEWIENSAAARRGLKLSFSAKQNISRAPRGNNRLITYLGVTQHLSNWSRTLSMNLTTLLYRINAGWSIGRAFETPNHTYHRRGR